MYLYYQNQKKRKLEVNKITREGKDILRTRNKETSSSVMEH